MSISARTPARSLPSVIGSPRDYPTRIRLAVVFGVLLSAAPATAQNIDGMIVTVPNPISSQAVDQIRATVDPRIQQNAAQPVTTVIFDFNPDGKPAASADFGSCLNLQEFIDKVNRAGKTTVAFVRANTTAHTVLPVLACRELVMSKGASLGQVVGGTVEPLNESRKGIYQDTLTLQNRTSLSAIVQKMYDPAAQLRWGIDKATGGKVYIDARDKNQAAKVAGATEVPGVQDGSIGLYPAGVAKDIGLCKATAENRAEVAELYGLPPLRDDPLAGRTPEPYRWVLQKDIDGSTRESLGRVLRDVRRKGGNILILEINAGGNDLDTARKIADDLRLAQTGEEPVKIVAFIPENAPAAGTVVALGCSEIVMARPAPDALGDTKEAVIGDFSRYVDPKVTKPADVEANLKSVRELAELQGYPGILIDGMFQRDLVILRVVGKNNRTLRRFMTREEFTQNQADWNEDKVVKPDKQLLKLTATQAAEYGLARMVVEGADAKAVTAAYGWNEARDADPGLLEKFSDFLRLPVVTVLLVVIGFTGLILELKLPGLTVPGILAALCFILVFWAHSKFSGQTFVLALLLFLLGLVLVGVEIFVLPGFGAAGIFGILSMLAGLGLVTLDKIPQTPAEWGTLGVRVSQYLFALMGAVALAITIAKFLPNLPGANRLVLDAPPEGVSGDVLPGAGAAAELLGAIGTTSTPLRPAGVVKFGEKFVDVVSDGDFVPSGSRVQVIQVEGTRIVVKEV